MPRNLSGKMTVINTFVPGTTITALSHNENWADAANEISNSIAADGQTFLTGSLKGIAGSPGAPAFTFSADLDTGLYRAGADIVGLATGGVARMTLSPTLATLTVPLQAPDYPFPTSTRMIFNQGTAPTGWVKDTSLNDRTVRIVNGAVNNFGGTIPFSTFVARTATDGVTLAVGNLPSHRHTGTTASANSDHTHGYSGTTTGQSADHTHSVTQPTAPAVSVAPTAGTAVVGSITATNTGGSSQDHTHGFSGTTGGMSAQHQHTFETSFVGDGGSFAAPIDCRLAYTDVIVAVKA